MFLQRWLAWGSLPVLKPLNPLNRQPACPGSARLMGYLTPLIASQFLRFCPAGESLNPLIASQPLRVLPGPWVT
ncbi:hypothetical protein FC565_20600 [Escherichia coli]|nr:hypothetical protein [Escherichia coli]HAL7311093.1 hypothetical protein [Escherichia coli]HAZ7398924.1 hypothetical protein [Escherichia coli]HCO7774203.1 hypothetical protein [Escherichia coli]HEK3981636.1 hypothetical protein [Escherichia coli]